MSENYVEKVDFIETISDLRLKTERLDSDMNHIKSKVDEIHGMTKELSRIITRSNGGESMIDKVNRHDGEIGRILKFIDEQVKAQQKRWATFVDIFWKYTIRIVVIGALLAFLSIFIEHGEKFDLLIKSVLK